VRTIEEPGRKIPVMAETDVLVVGGGPGGLSAALAAAREGVETMLVERYGCFGGVITQAMIGTIAWYRSNSQVVDAVRKSDHHWELQAYNRWFTKKRTVDIFFNDNFRFDGFHLPNRLKLTSHGFDGYTLDMDLIEAVSLEEHQ